ncbi:MAG: FKBP-type peptidyl-prolyl cis-trans isomerase [Myxococcota bacterium]
MMRAVACGALLVLWGCTGGMAEEPVVTSSSSRELAGAFYSVGYGLAAQLEELDLTEEELAHVLRGFSDGARKARPEFDLTTERVRIAGLLRSRQEVRADRERAKVETEKALGLAVLDKAVEEGAERVESGLVFQELVPGTGDSPAGSDRVKVSYRGTLLDGTEFDSSEKRGGPLEYPLYASIRCWQDGLRRMKVGGRARLLCPSELGYGDRGRPPMIPGGAVLVFEVELLDVLKPQSH